MTIQRFKRQDDLGQVNASSKKQRWQKAKGSALSSIVMGLLAASVTGTSVHAFPFDHSSTNPPNRSIPNADGPGIGICSGNAMVTMSAFDQNGIDGPDNGFIMGSFPLRDLVSARMGPRVLMRIAPDGTRSTYVSDGRIQSFGYSAVLDTAGIGTRCNVTDVVAIDGRLSQPGETYTQATDAQYTIRYTESDGRVYTHTFGYDGFFNPINFRNVFPNVPGSVPAPTLSNVPAVVTGDFNITVNFDEGVTGFDAIADVDVTNGTVRSISGSGSGPYTVNIRPTGGDLTVSVPADAAVDLDNNGNTPSSVANIGFNSAPIARAGLDQTVASGATVNLDGSTSSDPEGDNLTFAWRSSSAGVSLIGANTATPSFVAPTLNFGDATRTLYISLLVYDESGIRSSRSDVMRVRVLAPTDADAPVATLTTSVAGYTPGTAFTAQVNFDEPVDGMALSDFTATLSGGGTATITDFTPIAGFSRGPFEVTITPSADAEGDLTVRLNDAAAQDQANNDSGVVTTVLMDADMIGPIATIVPSVTDFTPGVPFTAEVTFNEPVDGMELSDFAATLSGMGTAVVSDFVGPAGLSTGPFTVTITPSADAAGDLVITLADAAAQDQADNDSALTFVNMSNPSDLPPAPVITGPEQTDGEAPFMATIDFGEPVSGFELDDLVITNGTPYDLTPSGPNGVFTVMITPHGNGDVAIDVADGVAMDDAGQPNMPAVATFVAVMIDIIEVVEDILTDDLFVTTKMLSQNASRISRNAADRVRSTSRDQCSIDINTLLQADPVKFASDSFVIDGRNTALLDNIALALQSCEDASFMIAGHTDSDASDAYNLTLSQNRVDQVRAALIRRGIADDRLQTRGYGEARPIADNATEAGKALNRRVEFILIDAGVPTAPGCGEDTGFGGTADGNATNDGANLTATVGSDGYNCATGVRTQTWGDVNVTYDEDRGTIGMANFGMSKETQSDGTLRGRFIEGYVSRNDVDTEDAEGAITGVGVHAGLYGARGADNGLILSYYGSAAVGRHSFDLTIIDDVDGDYSYAAIFAGAAVSGQRALGAMTIKPSAGIDLAYAETFGSDISTTGTLDIDPANYARGFVELGMVRDLTSGTLEVTPRVFCETSRDTDADACGFGAQIDFTSALSAAGTAWNVAFDYEMIDSTHSASFKVTRSQDILNGLGTTRSSFGMSQAGALQAEQTVNFAW